MGSCKNKVSLVNKRVHDTHGLFTKKFVYEASSIVAWIMDIGNVYLTSDWNLMTTRRFTELIDPNPHSYNVKNMVCVINVGAV